MRMVRIPSLRGGDQEMVTLRLDRLHGWLFSVDSGRVREANDNTSLGLRLCNESRQIHGNRAADQLWIKLGLPRVPAMDEAFRQGDLFDQKRAA